MYSQGFPEEASMITPWHKSKQKVAYKNEAELANSGA
jgi:hypothetical protein